MKFVMARWDGMKGGHDPLERFVSINTGDSYSFQQEITEKMVESFAELSGDYNPVHMDNNYCLEHGIGSRIAHGMLVLSLVSTLIGMHLPGKGTVWLSQSFDFISPARIGDVLTITGNVWEKNSNNSLELGVITMKIGVMNQKEVLIVRGTVKVLIK
jgi:3-hydroxybutyryl-CoA dehydratase